nr:ribonuclease H-like domain-containing protein [Tanacetum cinerariifolium]
MAMLFVRVHKFEQKAGRKIDFDKKESARFNKKKVRCYKCQQRDHDSESDGVIAAKEFEWISLADWLEEKVLMVFWFYKSSNTDDDTAFGGKKPEFEGRKPESEVHVSLSSSAQTKKHDDMTKREAKGKSPVESSTGYRNLSAEFEDFSDNSINEVNAVDSPVPAVGQISTNNTNTFSDAGPSNTDVSPTHGKSSYVNTSQYPDDPNIP